MAPFFKNETSNTDFVVGQEWHYETRANEENSTLKILKIDNVEANIIHIAILGLKLKNIETGDLNEEIGHVPISEEVLSKSVTSLKNNQTELPDFQSGYSHWKAAYDEGKAGFFTLSVKEIVQFIDEAINKK